MRLIIVRHGETVENKMHINQGQMPGMLSEEGIVQAQKLATRLKDERFSAIYVSDLKRTVDTAYPIIQHHPSVPVSYEPTLREICRAPFEGGPISELYEFFAQQLAAGVPNGKIRTNEGESIEDVAQRMMDRYGACHRQHQGETVLWVTHGISSAAFFCALLGYSFDREDVLKHVMGNAGVAVLSAKGSDKPVIDPFNCRRHLE